MSPLPTDPRFEQAKAQFLAGLRHQQAGDLAAAEGCYRASLALLPGRPSTLVNLAAVQLARGRPVDALASADAALAAEPGSTEALLHRGSALAQLGRPHEALVAFDQLLALDAGVAPAWTHRGSLLRELQRPAEAAQAFARALALGADAELHAYYLASVGAGAAAPPSAPPAYVQQLFDGYADQFDAHLVGQLGYQAPRRLVEGLAAWPGAAAATAALDLGCGTGLCGPLLRAACPALGTLTGVDLSPRMLDHARATGAYTRLQAADLVAFLATTDERFGLVLAADVFIYIGDLAPVLAGVRRVMPRGVFAFTVETAPDDAGPGFCLQPSLRYAHGRAYLARLAQAQGFEVLAMTAGPVRHDQHQAIDGLYVALQPGPPA